VERSSGLKAAVPYDDAYCFLYRENVECLQASGVEVRFFRPTEGEPLPDADMAYICGGYPELYAERISANRDFLEGMKQMSDEGRPILGECGGMMTLCSEMKVKSGDVYQMAGCFDATADMVGKRHGPTYVIAEATDSNPLFKGAVKGHEYHYSEVVPHDAEYCFRLSRGQGISGGMDGMLAKRTVGTYLHQHALSHEDWAKGFVESCR
jgi:cobyrinic acid a,c-diamide synthase